MKADAYTSTSSPGMILLLICAGLFVLFGLALSSRATIGVAVVTVGCFLAICARIAQAGVQHKEGLRAAERHEAIQP